MEKGRAINHNSGTERLGQSLGREIEIDHLYLEPHSSNSNPGQPWFLSSYWPLVQSSTTRHIIILRHKISNFQLICDCCQLLSDTINFIHRISYQLLPFPSAWTIRVRARPHHHRTAQSRAEPIRADQGDESTMTHHESDSHALPVRAKPFAAIQQSRSRRHRTRWNDGLCRPLCTASALSADKRQ